MLRSAERRRWVFAAALAALACLEMLWELWLAPLRHGGSSLALKALPLAAFGVGVARSRQRSAQWALLLLPWYVAEGVVRAWSETGRYALCAMTAALLALVALATGIAWVRDIRRS